MVISSARVYEQQNDRRLEELESKISMLKSVLVTMDIHKHASDMTMIDQGKEAVSTLLQRIQASSLRLNRALLVKTSILKYVCFFDLYYTFWIYVWLLPVTSCPIFK
ncbi:hypothetical protein PORY_001036, partial [Pneumocystis oryctolagi]